MNPLLKVRRSLLRMRSCAFNDQKAEKVEAYDQAIFQVDRQLKSRHDKTHDRRQRHV